MLSVFGTRNNRVLAHTRVLTQVNWLIQEPSMSHTRMLTQVSTLKCSQLCQFSFNHFYFDTSRCAVKSYIRKCKKTIFGKMSYTRVLHRSDEVEIEIEIKIEIEIEIKIKI